MSSFHTSKRTSADARASFGEFDAHKVYDDVNKIEAYYLTDSSQTMAIGWVHNLKAYWENHFYVKNDSTLQNFFGCTAPSSQQVPISGLQPGMDYHITWFPTRMNDTIRPADGLDQTGSGSVLLDMSTDPLGSILNNYLDTLHADYAFIVALQPVHKIMQVAADAPPVRRIEDFGMFPNPASNSVTLVLPSDGLVRQVTLYDLTGQRVFSRTNIVGSLLKIPTGDLARGAYGVRVSDPLSCKMKTLILR